MFECYEILKNIFSETSHICNALIPDTANTTFAFFKKYDLDKIHSIQMQDRSYINLYILGWRWTRAIEFSAEITE